MEEGANRRDARMGAHAGRMGERAIAHTLTHTLCSSLLRLHPQPFLARDSCRTAGTQNTRARELQSATMPKRTPEDQARRAAALLGKASKLQQASMTGRVVDIMKKHPDYVRPIFEYAERLVVGGGPRRIGNTEQLALTDMQGAGSSPSSFRPQAAVEEPDSRALTPGKKNRKPAWRLSCSATSTARATALSCSRSAT